MVLRVCLTILVAAAVLADTPAISAPLRGGDAFITAMSGNTLVGRVANGTPFKIYFLPGGQVTIQQGSGSPEYGTWSIDNVGDVCVTWAKDVAADSGCFRVDVSGSKVSWSDKNAMHSGGLLGSVAPLDLQRERASVP
jgi:hypothetical protein